uniref:Transcription elongation factor Eaf N-terminal domain-containing protein n=1 Tax=Auxenochlorella protothecoides TaxID=3075 RepID=A0A1D1ZWJ2_AUXPR
MAWNPDQTYPITLGDSILGLEAPEHWTLRYDFKPASAAESGQGRLSVDHATQRASFQRPSSVEGCPSLQFHGKYEPSKDGMDCVAIYDGQGFRLELVQAAVKNLRYQPTVLRTQNPVLASAAPACAAATPTGSGLPSPPDQPGAGAGSYDKDADELLHSLEEELLSELTGPSLATEESLDGASINTALAGVGPRACDPACAALQPQPAAAPRDQGLARPAPAASSPDAGTTACETGPAPASNSKPAGPGFKPGRPRKRARQASATPPPDLEGLNDLDREFFGSLSPASSDGSLDSGSDEDDGDAGPGEALRPDGKAEAAMDWTGDGVEEL